MKPPVIAEWLLGRFATNSALAGDLLEQYRTGRSRWWYWRQVLVAIVLGTWSDVRNHTSVAAGAVLMGWVVLLLVFLFGDTLRDASHGILVWTATHGMISSPLVVPVARFLPGTFLGFFLSGWVVGRVNRSGSMVLAYTASVFLVLTWAAATITWLHRPIPLAVVVKHVVH